MPKSLKLYKEFSYNANHCKLYKHIGVNSNECRGMGRTFILHSFGFQFVQESATDFTLDPINAIIHSRLLMQLGLHSERLHIRKYSQGNKVIWD